MIDADFIFLLRERSGFTLSELQRIIDTAPRRYKHFPIRKRNGGWRQIAQPARELKLLQRIVLEEVLSKYPVHSSAMAYEAGRNIGENAAAHLGARAILKLDFRDFFPSILRRDWMAFAKKTNNRLLYDQDIDLVSRLLFCGNGSKRPICLSIGAPTSPRLSNILMYDFDCTMIEIAKEHKVTYTRYADDLTISGSCAAPLLQFEKDARAIVRNMKSPKLQFNDDKRGLFHIGQKLMVTGLVLTPEKHISMGRERKRTVSALVHKASVDAISPEQMAQAKGLLAFAASVEPQLLDRLRKKYGTEIVTQIMKYEIPKKERKLPDDVFDLA